MEKIVKSQWKIEERTKSWKSNEKLCTLDV